MRSLRPGLATSFAVVMLAGCSHGALERGVEAPAPGPVEAPAGPHEGEMVLATVERLELMAHEEWLDDGSVWVSNVVWLGIFAPQRFDMMLAAHVVGHPRIDGRPLLLGDTVTFVLPRNWRNRDLSLKELEGLAFGE